MKFTKDEKEIIKAIAEGQVYDIYSFILFSGSYTFEKADKQDVEKRFIADNRYEKIYYRPRDLSQKKTNLLTQDEYNKKISEKKISADSAKKYIQYKVKLSYDSGILHQKLEGTDYIIDFYEGIYIPKDFNKIVSFLALWQYLKSERLIFESSTKMTSQSLNAFCKKIEPSKGKGTEEQTSGDISINYEDMTVSDSNYLPYSYMFSMDRYELCREFVDKHIIPAVKLQLFVKNGFKTAEERSRLASIIVAWVAIIVSIAIAILSIVINLANDKSEQIINKMDSVIIELHEQNKKSQIENDIDSIEKKEEKQIELLTKIEEILSKSDNSNKSTDNNK